MMLKTHLKYILLCIVLNKLASSLPTNGRGNIGLSSEDQVPLTTNYIPLKSFALKFESGVHSAGSRGKYANSNTPGQSNSNSISKPDPATRYVTPNMEELFQTFRTRSNTNWRYQNRNSSIPENQTTDSSEQIDLLNNPTQSYTTLNLDSPKNSSDEKNRTLLESNQNYSNAEDLPQPLSLTDLKPIADFHTRASTGNYKGTNSINNYENDQNEEYYSENSVVSSYVDSYPYGLTLNWRLRNRRHPHGRTSSTLRISEEEHPPVLESKNWILKIIGTYFFFLLIFTLIDAGFRK